MTATTAGPDSGSGSGRPSVPSEPLRVGLLGAARIAELAIVKPARATGTRLVAIAARDQARASAFAAEHGVERALASYADVVSAPDVEAVYNPLPNALHGTWNLAAIAAGKHVLSEKPFAANAEEAADVAAAAHGRGVVVVEGFHYLYHPVTRRLHELLASGELGELVHVETTMEIQDPGARDPRWSLDLAGGATMDLGCYSLHAQRVLTPWGGGEPELVAARARERPGAPGVDEWLEARLRFPSGATGVARCHMASDRRQMTYRVIGSRGEALVANFVEPHRDDRLIIRTAAGERVERHGTRSSYTYQLEAFVRAVREGAPLPVDVDDAVATMRLIDACYAAAGLRPRALVRSAGIPGAESFT
jgi:predicted dehydrogenase